MHKDEAIRIAQVIFAEATRHSNVAPTVTVLRDDGPMTFAVLSEPDLDDLVHTYMAGMLPLVPTQAAAARDTLARLEPRALVYLTGATAVAHADGEQCESLVGWLIHVESGDEHIMAIRRVGSSIEALDLSETRIEGIDWVKALL